MASVALGAHLVTKTSFFGFFGIFDLFGGYPPILAKMAKNPIFDPPHPKNDDPRTHARHRTVWSILSAPLTL